MKISLKDLEQAVEYIKRRTTDTTASITIDSGEATLLFYDVDQNQVIISIYDSNTSRKARIRRQDYLEIAMASLKKP